MTLSEELGAVPSPSHSWMAPLVQDMLHDVQISLTEAVVTGPGKAVLFYGRGSLGEGLTTDKARDAAFLLTGVVWETSLPFHQPHDNSRRLMSNHPGHNRLPDKGKGARPSTCKSVDPTSLQV